MEKLFIGASQNDDGTFQLSINVQTTIDGVITNDSQVYSEISLTEVKDIINSIQHG